MKNVIMGCLGLALLGMPVAASAQGIPPGSYRNTCTNIRMDGDKLVAVCPNRAGGHSLTELKDPWHCADIVAGSNGLLQCQGQRGGGGPGYGQAPAPGYGPPPNSGPPRGYGEERRGDEWREHCDRLRYRARELRERLRYDLPPYERRDTERRLSEIRDRFRDDRCGDWRD